MNRHLHSNKVFFHILNILTLCLLYSCQTEKELTAKNDIDQDSISNSVQIDSQILKKDTMAVAPKAFSPKIIDKNIHSAYIAIANNEASNPVYNLNSGASLKLKFDYFEFDHPTFNVEFVHCDHNWIPSQMDKEEYLEGNFYQEIYEGSTSFNTTQNYNHFQYDFPNENISFLLGGNYYLIMLNEANGDTLLQLPFYVLDQQVSIEGSIQQASQPKYTFTHQQLKMKVDAMQYEIQDPYNNLFVQVKQNNRIDVPVKNIKPTMVMSNQYEFSQSNDFHFESGKEFRYIDLRSIQIPEARFKQSSFSGAVPQFTLEIDDIRSFKSHVNLVDMNGRFVIYTKDAEKADTESDYSKVKLRLDQKQEMAYEDIYIVGAFNNWQILPEYKMFYNIHDNQYQLEVFLKQGYYNYEYVTVPKGETAPIDRGYIEGHSRDTENDYFVYVYTKPIGWNYMNLIGISRINSRN